jgi:thioredoxin reductase
MHDVVIVGSGIAGLYTAYKLTKTNPNLNIRILEKNGKKYIGGRTGNDTFYGTNVVTGAGIGRKRKDKLLMKLIEELDVPTNEFKVNHHYSETIRECDVKSTFYEIKKEYEKRNKPDGHTFKDFALSTLGNEKYKNFIICSGYTDYEHEDAKDVLYYYGFEDNYSSWIGVGLSWKTLVEKLVNIIGAENVMCKNKVLKIEPHANDMYCLTTNRGMYITKKVVMATTINAVMSVVPGANKSDSIYQEIKGQPFLRVYGKFSKSSSEILKKYIPSVTIVPGPLQKLIPMDYEKGVYMITYNDNNSAKKIHNISENTKENRAVLEELIKKSLGIKEELNLISMKGYYWETGTHYYEPLGERWTSRAEFIKCAQRPYRNMYIAGEMISNNQGWVEGALESVNAIIKEL